MRLSNDKELKTLWTIPRPHNKSKATTVSATSTNIQTRNSIDIQGYIIHFFCFILPSLGINYEFWLLETAGQLDLGFLWRLWLLHWAARWCSGEITRLPPMWPGFKSRHQRHIWVEFVVGFLVFLRVLPVFSSPKKPTLPNSNAIRTRLNELLRTPMCFVGKQITITITYQEDVSEEREEYDPLDVRRLSCRLCF